MGGSEQAATGSPLEQWGCSTVSFDARAGTSLWQNRSFRRFFAGQFVTNAGDSLYTVAVLWLVFEMSGSSFLTGIASAILLLPWLLQILAGPVVDRMPLKRLLIGSQLLQGTVIVVLPLAAATDRLTVPVLFAVIPVLTFARLVMFPMQPALLPRIVDDDQLADANSALATVTLGLDMLFDAASGIIIGLFGAVVLFVIDSATFAIAALLFAGVRIPPSTASNATGGPVLRSYLDDLRAGFETLQGTVFVELVLLAAVFNLAVGITLAILPAFGSLLGGVMAYGFLLGALGIGRLAGSVLAPSLEGIAFGRLLLVGYAFGAGCWLTAVFVDSPMLTVVLFGLAWIPAGAIGVLTSTLNQTLFPTHLLGRISSIKGTAAGATLPLGSLLGGGLASVLGTTTTMGVTASGFGFGALYVLTSPRLRRLPAVSDAEPSDFDITIRGGENVE